MHDAIRVALNFVEVLKSMKFTTLEIRAPYGIMYVYMYIHMYVRITLASK